EGARQRRKPRRGGASVTQDSELSPYLMKRISEYFGSGQSSSGTIFSSRSATARTASIAGTTLDCAYLASASASPSSGKSRLAASRANTASTNSSSSPPGSSRSRG